MVEISFEQLQIGDRLPDHSVGPISRTTLALFCGGSGDHNPIHIDSDFAKKAGMSDVFAHGMLSMAYLGQLLTNWVDQDQILELGVRFLAITPIHTSVLCTGEVKEKLSLNGRNCVRLDIRTHIDDGTITLSGDALIALS